MSSMSQPSTSSSTSSSNNNNNNNRHEHNNNNNNHHQHRQQQQQSERESGEGSGGELYSQTFQRWIPQTFYGNLLRQLHGASFVFDTTAEQVREGVWRQLFSLMGAQPIPCSRKFSPIVSDWLNSSSVNLLAVELLFLAFATTLENNPALLSLAQSTSFSSTLQQLFSGSSSVPAYPPPSSSPSGPPPHHFGPGSRGDFQHFQQHHQQQQMTQRRQREDGVTEATIQKSFEHLPPLPTHHAHPPSHAQPRFYHPDGPSEELDEGEQSARSFRAMMQELGEWAPRLDAFGPSLISKISLAFQHLHNQQLFESGNQSFVALFRSLFADPRHHDKLVEIHAFLDHLMAKGMIQDLRGETETRLREEHTNHSPEKQGHEGTHRRDDRPIIPRAPGLNDNLPPPSPSSSSNLNSGPGVYSPSGTQRPHPGDVRTQPGTPSHQLSGIWSDLEKSLAPTIPSGFPSRTLPDPKDSFERLLKRGDMPLESSRKRERPEESGGPLHPAEAEMPPTKRHSTSETLTLPPLPSISSSSSSSPLSSSSGVSSQSSHKPSPLIPKDDTGSETNMGLRYLTNSP